MAANLYRKCPLISAGSEAQFHPNHNAHQKCTKPEAFNVSTQSAKIHRNLFSVSSKTSHFRYLRDIMSKHIMYKHLYWVYIDSTCYQEGERRCQRPRALLSSLYLGREGPTPGASRERTTITSIRPREDNSTACHCISIPFTPLLVANTVFLAVRLSIFSFLHTHFPYMLQAEGLQTALPHRSLPLWADDHSIL